MIRTHRSTTRIWAWPLAVALVVVQFAAVQHAVDHRGAAVDAGCEFCVAGHAPAPPAVRTAEPPRPAAGIPLPAIHSEILPVAQFRAANRVRAPPARA